MNDSKVNAKKLLVTCPVCGYKDEINDFSKDNEVCANCGKSTYTFRTVDSIRNVFVGELNKKTKNE